MQVGLNRALLNRAVESCRYGEYGSFEHMLFFFLSAGSCLSAADTSTPAVSAQPLGEVYTPDDICRLVFGPSSHFCRVSVSMLLACLSWVDTWTVVFAALRPGLPRLRCLLLSLSLALFLSVTLSLSVFVSVSVCPCLFLSLCLSLSLCL